MISEFGTLILTLSFLFILYAFISTAIGSFLKKEKFITSGKRALIVSFIYILLASILLIFALIIGDYSIHYVALQVSNSTPIVYRIAGFWAGMDGSMLFWNLIYGIYIIVFLNSEAKKYKDVYNFSLVLFAMVYLFFISVVLFFSNPFKPTEEFVNDGRGLNPLLFTWWMHVHPLTLYLGYTGIAIPFAITIGMLIARNFENEIFKILRKWLILPWIFLTIGIYFGGRWAYLELGWGGYWAWDPVENASFIPWLTLTALIHSTILSEKFGMFKMWNVFLSIITFTFVLLGTYITRSGALVSVHSFAQSELGNIFFGFMVFILFLGLVLFFINYNNLKSQRTIENLISREGAYLLNNWILTILAFIVAFGTLFPFISNIVINQQVVVGATFFEKSTYLPFTIMLFLMAFAPYIPYGSLPKGHLKRFIIPIIISTILTVIFYFFIKDLNIILYIAIFSIFLIISNFVFFDMKRTRAGMLVHLGVAILSIGIVANTIFKERKEVILKVGESVEFSNYKIKVKSIENGSKEDYFYNNIKLEIQSNGKNYISNPQLRFYHKWNMKTPEVDIISSIKGDMYVAIGEVDEETNEVYMVLFFEPFIQLVWLGPILMAIGGILRYRLL
ncbi:MAG: cytochrome c biogenesis protein CcsA [candidate division WOR-3 bacterium]|nr:cytochrome c biogenesis protein CcsA [candidate division WOR-3 bacterium]MCX7947200.1 cytochrome c biogenesis protein CcsA [candidate division WOR-3 bacterium]MDW8150256.1 cytochrome c-type biogenesis CcmF C-terminal domain-containing protein [candidate division WOR-3 bacterium]